MWILLLSLSLWVAGVAESLDLISPIPSTQPTGVSVWKGVRWSPDGTYLAVTGDDNEVLLYKWDGSSLSYLNTYDPQSSGYTGTLYPITLAWDPSSTYLAVGMRGGDNASGDWHSSVAWFKRTGDTLSLMPKVETIHPDDDAGQPDVYALDWHPSGEYLVAGHYKRYRNALTVFKRTGDTSLDIVFPDPALEAFEHPHYGEWQLWEDDPFSDVYGASWADSTYLAVAHWGGDSGLHYLNMYEWDDVAEELSLVDGGAPALPDYLYPYDIEFDPTGTYLAYATDGYDASPADSDGALVRIYKHNGSGTLTDLEVAFNNPGGDGETVWGKPSWDATGRYLVIPYEGRSGPWGSWTYFSGVMWLERTGDAFSVLPGHFDAYDGLGWGDGSSRVGDVYSTHWHPSDAVIAVVAGDSGFTERLFLLTPTGIAGEEELPSGAALKILPLLTTIGNPNMADITSVWDPWRNDFWEENYGEWPEEHALHPRNRGLAMPVEKWDGYSNLDHELYENSAELYRFAAGDELFFRVFPPWRGYDTGYAIQSFSFRMYDVENNLFDAYVQAYKSGVTTVLFFYIYTDNGASSTDVTNFEPLYWDHLDDFRWFRFRYDGTHFYIEAAKTALDSWEILTATDDAVSPPDVYEAKLELLSSPKDLLIVPYARCRTSQYDDFDPLPGWWGPFNPTPYQATLPLLTTIGNPIVGGGNIKTLPLLTRIEG